MKMKSKWYLWAAVLIACHCYLYFMSLGNAEYRQIGNETNWAEVHYTAPTSIIWIYGFAWWFLLISLIELSISKILRWIGILCSAGLAITLAYGLFAKQISEVNALLFWMIGAILVMAAATSIVVKIVSWMKGRKGKLSTY
jgi:hypothetical protein